MSQNPHSDPSHSFLSMLPSGIVVSSVRIDNPKTRDVPNNLVPANAVTKRKSEFRAGRLAAYRAMESLGVVADYPGVGANRQPLWPEGIVGSITHDGEYAVAVAALNKNYLSVGVDLEDEIGVSVRQQQIVLVAAEFQLWGQHLDESLATRLFSYKEAIYKCTYPLHQTYLDFQEVVLAPPIESPRADTVDENHAIRSMIRNIEGVTAKYGERTLAACWIRRTDDNEQ